PPVPAALVSFMSNQLVWRGTPSELLTALDRLAPNPRPKDWPIKPNTLTNRLRRLAPDLRRVHRLDVDCDGRSPHRKRVREVTIRRLPRHSPRQTAGENHRPDRPHRQTLLRPVACRRTVR